MSYFYRTLFFYVSYTSGYLHLISLTLFKVNKCSLGFLQYMFGFSMNGWLKTSVLRNILTVSDNATLWINYVHRHSFCIVWLLFSTDFLTLPLFKIHLVFFVYIINDLKDTTGYEIPKWYCWYSYFKVSIIWQSYIYSDVFWYVWFIKSSNPTVASQQKTLGLILAWALSVWSLHGLLLFMCFPIFATDLL